MRPARHCGSNIVATWEWHDDPVIYRVVEEACYAFQRAARCRRLIDEQGEVLRTKAGLRSHPLIREETAAGRWAAACWPDWARIWSRCTPDRAPARRAWGDRLMPTKRVRRGPRRIGGAVPQWVRDLVERGVQPEPGDDGADGFFGWYFCGDEVVGLPLADSPEGQRIVARMKPRRRRRAA